MFENIARLFLIFQYFSGYLRLNNAFEPISYEIKSCQTAIPGDCNPYSCQGTCEGRYLRFWDSYLKLDRTSKSCQCVQVIR